MEKSAKRTGKNFAGLLILLMLSATSALPAKVSWVHLWGMRFRPAEDTLFTEDDNSFFVEIENVTPDSVQISVNSLPPNVSFVSQKKESVLIERGESQGGGYVHGTRILLWMRFAKTGFYKIKPIDLTIDGGFYRIPVEGVEVFQNPRFIHPEVNVVFQNQNLESAKNGGKRKFRVNAGEHVIFTVTARYMESIQNVFWNIPENSIFKKIKEHEFKQPEGEKKFITQFQDVATFDWQPLSEGEHELPEIFLTATSYNGSVEDIECPAYKFTADESRNHTKETKEEIPFVYAFAETEKKSAAKKKKEALPQEVLELYELHKKERHSFVFSKVTKERKNAEMTLGLPCDYHEPSLVLLNVLCAVSCLLLAVMIVFMILKRRTMLAVSASFFILAAVFSGIYGVKVKEVRGVFTGGEMSPIPEHDMLTSFAIQPGSVVSIIRIAGDWMYVRHNDTYGWISSDSVCLIK